MPHRTCNHIHFALKLFLLASEKRASHMHSWAFSSARLVYFCLRFWFPSSTSKYLPRVREYILYFYMPLADEDVVCFPQTNVLAQTSSERVLLSRWRSAACRMYLHSSDYLRRVQMHRRLQLPLPFASLHHQHGTCLKWNRFSSIAPFRTRAMPIRKVASPAR